MIYTARHRRAPVRWDTRRAITWIELLAVAAGFGIIAGLMAWVAIIR